MTYGRAIEGRSMVREMLRGRKSWPHVLSPRGEGQRELPPPACGAYAGDDQELQLC